MSLSDRINDKFEQWATDVSKGIGGFIAKVVAAGMEGFQHRMGIVFKPLVLPVLREWQRDPDTPQYMRTVLDRWITEDGEWQGLLAGSLGGTAIGGGVSAAMSPWLENLKRKKASEFPFMNFDYPVALSAWLRGNIDDATFKSELMHLGWHEWQVELFKEIVFMRLDPIIVQSIWLRDKDKYEKFWKDLHDIGWDDERIAAYKELAMILPSAQDLIRMAVREVFTPEIAEKFGQFEDFPKDFAHWGEKIGLTEQWTKNFWAAHWDLPSAGQGFEMMHRGVITYDELKILLRALDVMPFWRDRLIKVAYAPYTRVDIRRMYKLGILDREGVKKAYKDIGYDDEHAEGLTVFTEKYYATSLEDETDLADEESAKDREVTKADLCDGYKRAMLTRDEATRYLSSLGYNPAQIDYYLDREDLKATQELRDAYVSNYHDLYVTGIIYDDDVRSVLTELGLAAAEVDQLLKLWYIERIRRAERPSRTDLARFLRKGIITAERWRLEMAKLGYNDEYTDWYQQDATS